MADKKANEEIVLHTVDISHITKDGWLLKLPAPLVDKWRRAPRGQRLAEINSNKKTKSFTITLPPLTRTSTSTENELDIKEKIKNTKVFVRDQNKNVTFVSDIGKQGTITLQEEQIRELLEEEQRIAEENKTGKTELTEDTILKGRSKMEPLREKNPVVEKMESDLLRNKLFELFSQREYWTVKELQQSTGQSQPWLREHLDEICDPIVKGPYKSHFELKQEYRTNDAMQE